MGMASRDMSFDTWFNNVRSNDYIGDEFCLSALCQMCQRHALVVTSVKVWTTIPASFQKTEDEIRRLCDIHLLYVCKDMYSVIKPVFEWKREMPIGEIDLVTPPAPLDETTEVVLARESNDQNTIEIKEETSEVPVEGDEEQDPLGLVDIPPLPDTPYPLPDATVNRLVELPGVNNNDQPMDATITVPIIDLEGEPMDATIPPKNSSNVTGIKNPTDVLLPVQNMATAIQCSIVLKDVSVKLQGKTSILFPPVEEEMYKAKVCLQRIDQPSSNQPRLRGRKGERTNNNRLARRAKDDVKYVLTDATSGEDTVPSKNQKTVNKSAPSRYRLAAHQYMVAKKKGLINEPRTRTRALQFKKVSQTNSTDSEATLDYMSDNAPPPRKRRRRQKIVSKGKLVTKSFVLRKNGKGTQTPTKRLTARKKIRSFKCIKCDKYCKSVRALNQHFKEKHRPLQCSKCSKFFATQGALKLHAYKHKDGQFECQTCRKTFPFKSQLEQRKPSHVVDQPHKCTEKGCRRRFTHEHDLKKHLKAHDGEEHYCPRCNYSNPDERLLKQDMNKHLKIPKYFCKNCGKGHIYSMQLKRHNDKGC